MTGWSVGSWLSAALDDPNVCEEMKTDIREWFDNDGHIRRATPPHRGCDGCVEEVTTSYALLARDERIKNGDEHLCDDCETWEPVTGLFIGMAYSPAVMVPVRRRIQLDTAPDLCV